MTILDWLTKQGIQYKDEALYQEAFIHTSYLNEHKNI